MDEPYESTGDMEYHKTSNMSCTLVDNKFVDHSDVFGALPVGAVPTTSSSLTWHLASVDWAKTTAEREETFKFGDLVRLILEVWW